MVNEKFSYKVINGITAYRIVAAPVMLLLIFTGEQDIFKWLLPVSFFTDAIDGFLARKYKVASIFGAKLDSIGDDLTVLAGIVGLFVFKFEFIKSEILVIGVLLALLAVQNVLALIRYGKISSYHTYLAKIAALLQGIFLILSFHFPEPVYALFYIASVITIMDLAEEIILVFLLPQWKMNVKGLYWVLKTKSKNITSIFF
ncbi:MAG: CDP-alcohol phosphatidyltransferase family protein [Bacteroidetes bacterium]|nr:MAG: CDP-alcohol phosphatidyltransferase family protein [Bacteroidota bacterium]